MRDVEESGISPLSYLKVFFRRKELVLIPVFAGLILGICAGIVMPRQYKSETIILVQGGKVDNPLFDHLTVSTTVKQRLAGLRESILGWNSLVELVKRLQLDKEVRTKLEFEDLIMDLRKNILIRLKGHNIIHLAYIGDEPEQTQAVVKNITDIFISRNVVMQNEETADAIAFIEEQLRVYKGKIKSAEIAQLQERLDALLVDSTDQHPLVKQLKDQIGAKKEELRKENLEYSEDINLSNRNNNPMIDEIKKALDSLETSAGANGEAVAENQKDMQVMVNLDLKDVLARDVAVNERIYNMLLQRLETAKITQRLQSSKEGTRYTILDPPRVPLKPFKPNRIVVAFIGMVLGLFAGVGLVIAAEFLDKSFLDVEEAKNYLGVTLLGAISKISTSDSIRKEREKQAWMYSMTVVIGVVVVILTATVANFLQ